MHAVTVYKCDLLSVDIEIKWSYLLFGGLRLNVKLIIFTIRSISNDHLQGNNNILSVMFMGVFWWIMPTFLQVVRTDILGWQVLSIERGCTSVCAYGCKFNGYGLTYMKCTSCCRNDACNTDSIAAKYQPANFVVFVCLGLTFALGHHQR